MDNKDRLLSDEKIESIFDESRQDQHHNNAAGRNSRFEEIISLIFIITLAAVIMFFTWPVMDFCWSYWQRRLGI